MKRTAFVIFILFVFVFPAFAENQLIDRVIAVVNDEPITQSELDVLLRPIYEQYKEEFSGERLMMKLDEARQKLLNQLIEDRLVLQEAESRKLVIDEREITKRMDEFKRRFKNEEALEEALRMEGLTMKTLRARIRKQLMVRTLHDEEIRSKVVVSPLEVQEYYKEHSSEFSSEERLKIRSITIRKSDEAREKGLTDEDALKRMRKIRERILAGEDFGEIAKQVSEDTNAGAGGLTDWIHRGEMIPVIDEVIFKMKKWEISDIIETPMGYHLFRLEEREEGNKQSFEDVRDKIFNTIFMEKANKRFQEWMQELKRNAYISIR